MDDRLQNQALVYVLPAIPTKQTRPSQTSTDTQNPPTGSYQPQVVATDTIIPVTHNETNTQAYPTGKNPPQMPSQEFTPSSNQTQFPTSKIPPPAPTNVSVDLHNTLAYPTGKNPPQAPPTQNNQFVSSSSNQTQFPTSKIPPSAPTNISSDIQSANQGQHQGGTTYCPISNIPPPAPTNVSVQILPASQTQNQFPPSDYSQQNFQPPSLYVEIPTTNLYSTTNTTGTGNSVFCGSPSSKLYDCSNTGGSGNSVFCGSPSTYGQPSLYTQESFTNTSSFDPEASFQFPITTKETPSSVNSITANSIYGGVDQSFYSYNPPPVNSTTHPLPGAEPSSYSSNYSYQGTSSEPVRTDQSANHPGYYIPPNPVFQGGIPISSGQGQGSFQAPPHGSNVHSNINVPSSGQGQGSFLVPPHGSSLAGSVGSVHGSMNIPAPPNYEGCNDLFTHGRKVVLKNVASGGFVCCAANGKLSADSKIVDNHTQWIVHRVEGRNLTLLQNKGTSLWLRMHDGGHVGADRSLTQFCEFRIIPCDNNRVVNLCSCRLKNHYAGFDRKGRTYPVFDVSQLFQKGKGRFEVIPVSE